MTVRSVPACDTSDWDDHAINLFNVNLTRSWHVSIYQPRHILCSEGYTSALYFYSDRMSSFLIIVLPCYEWVIACVQNITVLITLPFPDPNILT